MSIAVPMCGIDGNVFLCCPFVFLTYQMTNNFATRNTMTKTTLIITIVVCTGGINEQWLTAVVKIIILVMVSVDVHWYLFDDDVWLCFSSNKN